MCRRRLLTIVVVTLLFAACRKAEVTTYRVPKEELPALPTAAANQAGAGALTWNAPPAWDEEPAGGMRRGSFKIRSEDGAEADFSIIAFPGAAGGLASNLNRWRGQLGLPTLPTAEVEATVVHLDTPTFHVDFVDYVGETDGQPTRIMGAILNHGGESWFFKLMGPDSLVAAQQDAFRAFMNTVAPAPARN